MPAPKHAGTEARIGSKQKSNREESRKIRHVGLTLLRRMTVAERCKGMGLGRLSLMSALDRSLLAAKDVATWALFVEAEDASAGSFYRKSLLSG
jgi:hypothetical protein